MKIYGKEYGFFMSVGATAELAKECKDGKIENLAEIYSESQGIQLEKIAKIVCILSDAYENRKFYQEMGHYEKQKLTVDMVLSLPTEEFTALQTEMLEAITGGAETEIAVKPKKEEAVPQE